MIPATRLLDRHSCLKTPNGVSTYVSSRRRIPAFQLWTPVRRSSIAVLSPCAIQLASVRQHRRILGRSLLRYYPIQCHLLEVRQEQHAPGVPGLAIGHEDEG